MRVDTGDPRDAKLPHVKLEHLEDGDRHRVERTLVNGVAEDDEESVKEHLLDPTDQPQQVVRSRVVKKDGSLECHNR